MGIEKKPRSCRNFLLSVFASLGTRRPPRARLLICRQLLNKNFAHLGDGLRAVLNLSALAISSFGSEAIVWRHAVSARHGTSPIADR